MDDSEAPGSGRFRRRAEIRRAIRGSGLKISEAARRCGLSYSALENLLGGRSGGTSATWTRLRTLAEEIEKEKAEEVGS